MTWQGKDTGFINCSIGCDILGIALYAAEIKGGDFLLENCRIKTFGDPSSVGRAVIDIGGNSDVITDNTVEDVNFRITNCKLDAQDLGINAFIFGIRNRGGVKKINVEVNGFDINVNTLLAVLYLDLVSGTADSDYIIVDNIRLRGTAYGKILAHLPSGEYTNFPKRMQSQSGKEELTTSTSSSFVIGSVVTFNWIYPTTPNIQLSRTGTGYLGDRIGVPLALNTSASVMTPTLATDDTSNFSAVADVDINWTVGINEV